MTPEQRDILLIPLPFTDLKAIKRRPVVVLSNNSYNRISDDVIVAAMTSNLLERKYGVLIESDDLEKGKLKRTSLVRADKIYTLNRHIIVRRFGRLKREKYLSVLSAIHKLIG